MANVDISLGYKNAAWFTANASRVLNEGQIVYLEQTGTYKLGDGVTQLSALSFLGGGGTVDVNSIGATINGASSATPNDTDLVMSVESSVAKKNTWTQIKAFLKTYFDTIYTTTSAVATQITTALSGYVKKGTLTINYIPKATTSDTIGDSSIFDDGTNVGIGTNTPAYKIQVNGSGLFLGTNTGSYFNEGAGEETYIRGGKTGAKVLINNNHNGGVEIASGGGNVGIGIAPDPNYRLYVDGKFYTDEEAQFAGINTGTFINYGLDQETYIRAGKIGKTVYVNDNHNGNVQIAGGGGNVNLPSLTASQIVETDASKNLVSVAKGTAYNKNFGTSAGTVLEGNRITQTITNGVTDKAPSEDAVYDALANKLTSNTIYITTGDQTTTSNLASDITGLVTPTLTINKRYRLEGEIHVGCNNTGGVALQFTLPTGATIFGSYFGFTTSNVLFIQAAVIASSTLYGAVCRINNPNCQVKVDLEIQMSTTSGTVQVGFASATSGQVSTIYQLGTFLRLTPID